MMSAGIASGLGSLAGGLAGMFGGGNNANNVQLPPQQSMDLSGITSNINSSIPQLGQYNMGGQNYGQYGQFLQNAVYNPYGPQGVQTAQAFAPQGVGAAAQGAGNASMMGGTVPGLIGAAGQMMNTAFDPQQALFHQQQDLQSQQSLAGLAGSGLQQTPWGQGVYGKTMGDFDINWQNNLLGRMATGAQGAEGLLGQAGNMASGAFQMGTQAPGAATGAAMLPYNTQNQINMNQLGALTGGAQYGLASSQIPQTGIGDWMQYLGLGNQTNQVANQTAGLGLQQQQQGFNQNQVYGANIGAGLAGLGNAYNRWGQSPSMGGGGGSSGGGGYSTGWG